MYDATPLRGTGHASVAGGALSLASLVAVFAGEAGQGADAFITSTLAKAAGFAGFFGACLLVVGLVGLAVRYAPILGSGARAALGVMAFATSVAAGSASTLALVVPWIADDMPEITMNPPAVVPPFFILSGLVMGVCGLVLAVALRRAAAAPGWVTTLLMIGSVVTIAPLPSRYFLLAFAVGALVVVAPRRSVEPTRESVTTAV